MSDKLTEWMEEAKRKDLYPIFVGTVAISKDRTLVTDVQPTTQVLNKLQVGEAKIPKRFREAIESLIFYNGCFDSAGCLRVEELFFWLSNPCKPVVHWTFEYSRGYFIGNRYMMTDKEAEMFFVRERFTQEELDWLWKIAQRLHRGNEPVIRRDLSKKHAGR